MQKSPIKQTIFCKINNLIDPTDRSHPMSWSTVHTSSHLLHLTHFYIIACHNGMWALCKEIELFWNSVHDTWSRGEAHLYVILHLDTLPTSTARSREDEIRNDHHIRIHNEILESESLLVFSSEPFEEKPVMTIEDFVLYSGDRFESRLLANCCTTYLVSFLHHTSSLHHTTHITSFTNSHSTHTQHAHTHTHSLCVVMQQTPVTFATFAHIALAPAYVLEGSLGKGTWMYIYTIFARIHIYVEVHVNFMEAQHIFAKVHIYVYRIFAGIHMYIEVYVIYNEPAYTSLARAYPLIGRHPWQRNIYLYKYLNCINVYIYMCIYECVGPSICI